MVLHGVFDVVWYDNVYDDVWLYTNLFGMIMFSLKVLGSVWYGGV